MRTISVVYQDDGPDGWSAESPDLPGYAAVADTLEDLRKLVRDGVPFFMETEQVEIDERFPFVAVSVTIATNLDPAGLFYVSASESTAPARTRKVIDTPTLPQVHQRFEPQLAA